MTDRPKSAKVLHPVLHLEVLGPDGQRGGEDRVFCRFQQRSVPFLHCVDCARCDAIVQTPTRAVACTIPVDPAELTSDPLGTRTPVGQLLHGGAFAVAPETTVHQVLALLHGKDARSVAVVDADSMIIGVFHETPSTAKSGGEVAGVMSSALCLREDTPIRRALGLLASAHLREATVVDAQGVPLGVFHDLDGLRWLVSARR